MRRLKVFCIILVITANVAVFCFISASRNAHASVSGELFSNIPGAGKDAVSSTFTSFADGLKVVGKIPVSAANTLREPFLQTAIKGGTLSGSVFSSVQSSFSSAVDWIGGLPSRIFGGPQTTTIVNTRIITTIASTSPTTNVPILGPVQQPQQPQVITKYITTTGSPAPKYITQNIISQGVSQKDLLNQTQSIQSWVNYRISQIFNNGGYSVAPQNTGSNNNSGTSIDTSNLSVGNLTASGAITGNTILMTGSSTFSGGLSASNLTVTDTTATSTFGYSINLTSGCFAINNVCVAGGVGSGIIGLNGLATVSQTFATTSDTNIGLTIVSSGSTHTFISNWIGTLASGRGGTGISSVTANQILIGNSGGTGFTQVATSGLAIAISDTTGTLAVNRGGTNITNPVAAGVLLGSYGGGSWQQLGTSSLGLITTNVNEGSNLYFTNTRADARINATSTISTLTSLPNLVTVGALNSGSISIRLRIYQHRHKFFFFRQCVNNSPLIT
jgi:hypothetical protein